MKSLLAAVGAGIIAVGMLAIPAEAAPHCVWKGTYWKCWNGHSWYRDYHKRAEIRHDEWRVQHSIANCTVTCITATRPRPPATCTGSITPTESCGRTAARCITAGKNSRGGATCAPTLTARDRSRGSVRARSAGAGRVDRGVAAHLLDRGGGAHRQKARVAADRDEGEAHLDHLLGVGRRAAMDAGHHAVPVAGVEHLFQRVHHPLVGLVAARRMAVARSTGPRGRYRSRRAP